MRRKLLLFLLLTTVFFRTSWASNDTIKDSFNDATTISPDVEYDEHETTTLSLVNADLDDAENSSNSTSKSITTLPDVTTVTNDDSTQTQTESLASSEYTTEEPVNQETTLPSSSDNLKDEIDKNLPKNNEDEPNTSASKPTDKTELNMDEESLSRIPVEPLTEPSNEPVEDGNNPSPDKISKRILISSAPESDMHPMNIDEFPEERLDSWRPLAAWSLPDENFASLSPTVRFPVDDSSNRDVHSPLQPSPGTQENFSVLKEPVTAYYFDLASVIPEQPSGPLHDPRIIRTRTHGHPSKINESPDILQGNLKSSFHDTNPPNQGSEDNVNSRFTSGIHPTPTLLRPVNTAEEIDLISNTEPEGASPPQTEDVTSSQNSEPTTIPSSHDTTATEFQKSTPAYTLGNSTDFHFTQGETNTVKNSTNTSSPDIMPSTLSSDQPLEIQNSTEKSTNNEHLHRNDSFEVPQPTNETRSSPSNLDEKRAVTLTNASSTPERIENDTTIHDSEDTDNVHTDVTDLSGVEELAPKTTDHSSEHSSTTAPTNTMAELPPSEVNTTAKAKTSPSSPPVSTPKATSVEYIPDNLEINIPADPQNTTSSDVLPSPVENINEEDNDDKVMIDVITEDVPGSEPLLHLVQMHANGTNSTDRIPFLKAEVFYNTQQYCKHQQNVENLLEESINLHLRNSSNDSVYEIEVFMPPDCKNIYEYNNSSTDNENITYVYFYVKQNGKISPQSTRSFPINPFELEISQELAYLKEKLGSLELQETSPISPPIEEADSAYLVVVVIVTSIVILLLIGGILACFMVKRRRSAEKEGRRCTPAANDAYSLDSVSVFYHSLRRKSKKRASNKSLKSYLNQGFDDPNLPSRPLSFAKLTLFITDNEAIYDEFSNIPSVNPKYDEMPRGVEDKNRYANVIPISETRILLGGSKTTPCAEYINANSIHGPKGELRYYIATQAPLDNTVSDFWQMVWEQESKIIVMLTDFVEKGIDKCADYLPPSETLDCHRVYGEFQITLKSRDMRENYIMSLLQIKNLENNLVREIAHMWYTGWPHSGVPNEEKLFISFIFDVRTTRKQLRAKGPIIVHCSPGTGRTGTYITCDLCMRQFDDQKIVDIPKTVFRIRRERAGAVQTKEQYAFIYRVVNLYAAKLTTGNLDSF